MEIISQVVGALIAVAVSLITTFASAKFLLKRETAKLEYFKSRFGPTYHVLIDTWDSLKFIHTLIEEEVKWDAETKWQHLFRFHSYQWTLKTDHLPDLKYLVSKKMLSEWDRLMLIGIMNHFDYLFHRYLSRQKHIPEEEYVKSEEFHYGKVFIRQIEIPTIDARARRGIKRLENELKLQHEKKNIEDALEILKEVINSLAEKI